MIQDAQSHHADDKKKRELADLRNNADGLIYTTEKSLEEYASMLSQSDRDEIKVDLENLKGLLDCGDTLKLKEAITRLEGSAQAGVDGIGIWHETRGHGGEAPHGRHSQVRRIGTFGGAARHKPFESRLQCPVTPRTGW